MDAIRLLSKPTYSVTLFILVIGTLAFFFIAIPSLMVLYEQGKVLEGLGLVMSTLGVVVPLGFGTHQLRADKSDRSLKQTNYILDNVSFKLMQNIIFLNLSIQEQVYRDNNIPLLENHLRASDLSDEEIKEMIPPSLEGKTELLLNEVRRVVEHVDLCRSVAKHLEASSERLKYLVVEAVDETLANLPVERLQRLGLQDLNARGDFYKDIYLYLRGWLKNSIEFDIPMPENRIVQSSLDRKLYLDTITLIREHKMEQFGLTDERQLSIVRRYLNILIDRLDA